MSILGITNTKNAGATLIQDGKIVAAVNEERFTRIKNHRIFPHKSIDYVLQFGKITIGELDEITVGCGKGIQPAFVPKYVDRICNAVVENKKSTKIIHDRCYFSTQGDIRLREEAEREIRKLGYTDIINFVDHHTAHAYSAYYCSPFDDSFVFTLDGRGDGRCMTLNIATRDEGIKNIDWLTEFDGLGHYYGLITLYLGFRPNRHEGKVLGLAAYGNPETCLPIMKKMVGLEHGRIKAYLGEFYLPHKAFLPNKLKDSLVAYSREDIAAACQFWLEHIVIEYLKPKIFEYEIQNICCAGGVFGSVKLNQRILEIEGIENIYIHPNMSDGGVGTGAALFSCVKNGIEIERPLETVYLGPEYNNAEIERELRRNKLEYEENRDIAKVVVEHIENKKVVGIFNGRMEYGPRALGNRSILYEPTDLTVNDWLNKRLHRFEIMPFAPVTLEEEAEQYYHEWKREHIASWFMTICYNCTEKACEETPAVIHIDKTARPQIIKKMHNPIYYDIVKEYYKHSGLASLINTSFNEHEEPIVCSPRDAIKSFLKDNVDILAIGNYIVEKKNKREV